jgi:hypothetical protein
MGEVGTAVGGRVVWSCIILATVMVLSAVIMHVRALRARANLSAVEALIDAHKALERNPLGPELALRAAAVRERYAR